MKVYVATAFDNWRVAREAMDILETAGHETTSDWVAYAATVADRDTAEAINQEKRKKAAEVDLENVGRADAILLLVPPRGGCGMWIEMGYAFGLGNKRVITAGYGLHRTIFSELAENYDSATEAIKAL